MSNKHTPGEWHAVTGQGAHHRDIYIRHGERQADGSWPAVAKCCSTRVGSFATVQANARLIAAAPDLLAACKAAKQYIEPGDHPCSSPAELLATIRAAIAKATESSPPAQ